MSEVDRPRKPRLPLEVARRLDPICDRFEDDWLEGRRPRLEEFLDRAPEADRPALLGELLALEMDYRLEHGEQPTAAEYCLRLPEYAGLIDAALAQLTRDPENAALTWKTALATHAGTTLALPAA